MNLELNDLLTRSIRRQIVNTQLLLELENVGMRNQRIDITNMRFGSWVVLEYVGGKFSYYECKCDCGTVRNVRSYYLRNGRSVSCGCAGRKK